MAGWRKCKLAIFVCAIQDVPKEHPESLIKADLQSAQVFGITNPDLFTSSTSPCGRYRTAVFKVKSKNSKVKNRSGSYKVAGMLKCRLAIFVCAIQDVPKEHPESLIKADLQSVLLLKSLCWVRDCKSQFIYEFDIALRKISNRGFQSKK
ncbi:hypothetical protein [Sphingobacterium hungaricum]|uniref:Uncharacterized protein n=1 Tax=Sphingobacterium hungaricum TaxID=2082723 RepID=A0A928UZ13_9SPHI|nr:hypothetical protein [Sphingobacterium hungaricum]MBE8714678.1 hypothetical protein [Sphingobacterium hungaricum]